MCHKSWKILDLWHVFVNIKDHKYCELYMLTLEASKMD